MMKKKTIPMSHLATITQAMVVLVQSAAFAALVISFLTAVEGFDVLPRDLLHHCWVLKGWIDKVCLYELAANFGDEVFRPPEGL